MVTLEAALLAVMLRQEPSSGDREEPAARYERLSMMAGAIAEVASDPPEGWMAGSWELAAELAATSYEEGQRWDLRVHQGKIRGDQGKAACLNQIHTHPYWFPRADWRASMGTSREATVICFRGAARVMAHYSRSCTQPWMGVEVRLAWVSAGYGSGVSCNPKGRPWAAKRARRAARWLSEMDAMREVET